MSSKKIETTLHNFYNDHYGSSQSNWRILSSKDKVKNIVKLCEPYKHSKILDVGAGDGSVLQGLSQNNFGKELYAVEITPNAIDIIKKNSINNLVEAKLYDGYHIPYPDQFFDLIVFSHVIEHLEHPRLLLYEAIRVAKFVFIEVPLENTIRQNKNFKPNKVGHINFYSSRDIRYLAQTSGLTVMKQIITNPSKEVYKYKLKNRGVIKYYIRQVTLKLLKAIIINVFTFHTALICESNYNKNTEHQSY